MSQNSWRLLLSPPAQGAWNMSVDEAILENAGRGEVPPTLRLYSWSPPCLSLGYAQSIDDVYIDNLQKKSWEIVRRPTGGKAILHTDELTYSICGPDNEPRLKGSVLESYQRLSLALLDGLNRMGIRADAAEKSKGQFEEDTENPVCFEVPSNYEITVAGKKIIGSAQARRKSGVLQHGSLPLFGDLARILQVLNFKNEQLREQAEKRLSENAATVETVLGYKGDWWLACQAFRKAFQEILSLKLIPGKLTQTEGQQAMELYQKKYTHPDWTERF
jgi:lipoate-protein ligase A